MRTACRPAELLIQSGMIVFAQDDDVIADKLIGVARGQSATRSMQSGSVNA